MTERPRQDPTVRVACLGDVVPGRPVTELVERFGAAQAAARLWEPLGDVNAVVANLEAPATSLTVPTDQGKRNRRIDQVVIDILDGRFLLGLANNHIMDFGIGGLEDTIGALDDAGIPHTGAGRTLDDAVKPVRLRTSSGFSLALVAAADARSVQATETSAGVAPARPEVLRDAITEAGKGSDTVIASLHAGVEHCAAPSRAQVEIAEACLAAGAHLVVIHHSHCLGGLLQRARGVVILGAGNYVFPPGSVHRPAHWYQGAVWEASYDPPAPSPTGVTPRPVVLDAEGLPRLAVGPARDRALRHVERWSSRTVDGSRGTLWRAVAMLHPGFVFELVGGFGRILRRQGPVGFFRAVTRSASSHARSTARP